MLIELAEGIDTQQEKRAKPDDGKRMDHGSKHAEGPGGTAAPRLLDVIYDPSSALTTPGLVEVGESGEFVIVPPISHSY